MNDGMLPEDLDDEFYEDEDLDVATFTLTVAESKRLIARGIAQDGRVMAAMGDGMVAVCKGTTNAYVLEELLGGHIEKGKYVLGRTVPQGNRDAERAFTGSIPEVVFRDGEPVVGMTVADAVRQMSPGDVVLKGANALDYQNGVAGVLIGHPEGGTLGAILGCVYGKGLHLIVPVGLEKQIGTPVSLATNAFVPAFAESEIPRLWPVPGQVYTEIEALDTLANVKAMQIGAGGVCGAEGAVWLAAMGLADDVEHARAVVDSLRGEPSFWDAVMRT